MVQHDFALAVSEMNVFDHCHRHYGLLFLLRIAVAGEGETRKMRVAMGYNGANDMTVQN